MLQLEQQASSLERRKPPLQEKKQAGDDDTQLCERRGTGARAREKGGPHDHRENGARAQRGWLVFEAVYVLVTTWNFGFISSEDLIHYLEMQVQKKNKTQP